MEQLYSLQSAAKKLDVSVRTVRRLIVRPDINFKRVGTRIRIPESELSKLVRDDKGKFEKSSIDGMVEMLLQKEK